MGSRPRVPTRYSNNRQRYRFTFLLQKNLEQQYLEHWKNLQPKTAELIAYFSKHIGPYPYKQYSVIQGGDGGMEYAMYPYHRKRNFSPLWSHQSRASSHVVSIPLGI